jgi:hypothetical protein
VEPPDEDSERTARRLTAELNAAKAQALADDLRARAADETEPEATRLRSQADVLQRAVDLFRTIDAF